LKDSKFSKIFRSPFSFIESSPKQNAAFLIYNKLSEFDSRSHNFWIRLSEYFYFSIMGVMFYKNTTNVLASSYFSLENLDKASGMRLKMIFGSFLLSSKKNCLTNPSIS
jgi:hypothetical protein